MFIFWLLMLSSLLILLIGGFWIGSLAAWGCRPGLGMLIFCIMLKFGFGSSLASGLGEPWTRDGGIPQGCPLSMMFIVALYLTWCKYLG